MSKRELAFIGDTVGLFKASKLQGGGLNYAPDLHTKDSGSGRMGSGGRTGGAELQLSYKLRVVARYPSLLVGPSYRLTPRLRDVRNVIRICEWYPNCRIDGNCCSWWLGDNAPSSVIRNTQGRPSCTCTPPIYRVVRSLVSPGDGGRNRLQKSATDENIGTRSSQRRYTRPLKRHTTRENDRTSVAACVLLRFQPVVSRECRQHTSSFRTCYCNFKIQSITSGPHSYAFVHVVEIKTEARFEESNCTPRVDGLSCPRNATQIAIHAIHPGRVFDYYDDQE
ncbi:hypothetical protein L218DRAFT_942484 [Marasmius fiardii PR-910]|nr:hypothetical protein L218DRAFT_942484 [Marasmius fiardii PR-910]